MAQEDGSQDQPNWLTIDKVQAYRGAIHGARQASLLIAVRAASPAIDLPNLRAAAKHLCDTVSAKTEQPPPAPGSVWAQSLTLFCTVLGEVTTGMGIVTADRPRLLRAVPDESCAEKASVLQVPVGSGLPNLSLDAVNAIARLIETALESSGGLTAATIQEAREALESRFPITQTRLLVLEGAVELGVPVYALSPHCAQFGQGSRSSWFETTMSENTSVVSVRIAGDKQVANARLRQAGLPAPRHAFADSEEAALAVARRLGFPVVVKPADKEQGLGVTADLRSEDELRTAFARAQSESRNVLVEKHFDGRDYRLVVQDGELLWAVERVPASVTGDGTRTVAQLVAAANADPRRSTSKLSQLYPIRLDEEAFFLLKREGLSENAIPEAGRMVRLARIANVARGGMPVIVSEQVHPDNRALAIDAASALRLDVAGIDLLIPDIAVSWHESGAAICEVNAGPQIGGVEGRHLGRELLESSLKGDGRIPVIAVVGDTSDISFAAELANALQAMGLRVGFNDQTGVWLDQRAISRTPSGAFAAGEILLTNRDCDAAVLSFADTDLLANGCASDRIDWIVIAGTQIVHSEGERGSQALFAQVVGALAAQCQGTIARLVDVGDVRIPVSAANVLQEPLTREAAIARILSDVTR